MVQSDPPRKLRLGVVGLSRAFTLMVPTLRTHPRVELVAAADLRAEALQQFVMSVAVRVLKWNLRARWVRRNVLLSDEGDLPEETGDRGSEEEARDALRRCRRILDRLAPQQQTAFTLRYMEEMTLEEVAATMEVSLSTAKRLLNRATAALARDVGADEDLRRFFLQPREGEP